MHRVPSCVAATGTFVPARHDLLQTPERPPPQVRSCRSRTHRPATYQATLCHRLMRVLKYELDCRRPAHHPTMPRGSSCGTQAFTCNDKTYLWHSAAWNSSNSSVPPKRTAHLNGPEASILGPASDLLAAGLPFTGLLGLDSNMAALCSPGRRRRVCALDTALRPGHRISLVSSGDGAGRRASRLGPRVPACGVPACGVPACALARRGSRPQDASTEWSTERAS